MKKYIGRNNKFKVIIILLFIGFVLTFGLLFINPSYGPSREKVIIIVKSGSHIDNGLVTQPIEYTIFNNSQKPIYYLSWHYDNPSVCKIENLGFCKMLHQTLYQGEPFVEKIESKETAEGGVYSLNLPKKYRLVFKYLDKQPDAFKFEKESIKIYSDILYTTNVPLSKESTLDICNSMKEPDQCIDTYKREFGAENYPISVNKLGERRDLLIGEDITVEGKIFLGYPDDESWPGPFTIWALLKDTSKYQETYEQIFLYENGEFIFCEAPQNYVEVCNGWENGKSYRISGILRKGILKREDTNDGYYVDVKNKNIIN